MSQKQHKKRRYNEKLAYIAELDRWKAAEPPIFRFFAWRRWLKNRPVYEKTAYPSSRKR